MRIIGHRQFRFNWRLSLFSAFFLGLFLNLGLWQIDRGDEKAQLMQEQEQLRQSPPVPIGVLDHLSSLPMSQPVSLTGNWQSSPLIFLDNVVLEGQVGYELLQLFVGADQQRVLVNRGFVAMERTRAELPGLPPLAEQPPIGEIYLPKLNQMGSPAVELWAPGVFRIQKLDTAALADVLQMEVIPVIVRLSADHPDALPRYWPVTNMLPEKHRGYAVQWFLMALAVGIAWSYFSFPKLAQDSEDRL